MSVVRRFSVCWPAETVEGDEAFAFLLDDFHLLDVKNAPKSIEREVVKVGVVDIG